MLLDAGVARARLRLVDPHPQLLACWERNAARTGMTYLRSPGVHHIGLDPYELFRFAGRQYSRHTPHFKGVRRRPSLALFQAHARHVERQAGLSELHCQARVEGVSGSRGGPFRVETDRGSLATRRLILAPGSGEGTPVPSWARGAEHSGLPVHALFGEALPLEALVERAHRTGAPIGVVGGGISAGQFALSLLGRGCPVTLLMRHPFRVEELDADPGWVGPKELRAFHAVEDPAARRRMIQAARHRGSMPEEVVGRLRAAQGSEHFSLKEGAEVEGGRAAPGREGAWEVEVAGVPPVVVSSVVLATGVGCGRPPGEEWIGGFATELELPRAPCGYPVPDAALQWGEGLHLSGSLAELELGPVARNIVGARMAGTRLGPVARSLATRRAG